MSKPKVTLDVGPLFDDQWTGIPVFTRRLAQSLLRHVEIDVEFVYKLTRIPNEYVISAIRAGTGTHLQGHFSMNADENRLSLIDSESCFLSPTVKNNFGLMAREASTVHDLSTLFMPENHVAANVAYHIQHFTKELATDEIVFCVSEATKAALSLAIPSVRHKARVLYQYVDWPGHFDEIERNLPRPQFGRYAAVIGTLEPRKNLGLLVRALSMPEVHNSKLKFVVIGKKGWNIDQFLEGLTPEDRERIIFSGFVSEFLKYRLLKHCEFLIFPSVYEGFGIPALEAMSLGKPVLASMTSSFPEVIGDAGVYFDPLSVTEFSSAFAEISHPAKLTELSRRALTNSQEFNWERMANPIVKWAKS